MSVAQNIVLDSGGTNEVTISTTLFEEIFNKKLVNITPPQSTSNWDSGPKVTKIVDLLRIEERFSCRGFVHEDYRTKLKNLFKKGGVMTMTTEDGTVDINMDKLTISKDKNEDDERDCQFTAIKGVDI